MSVDYQIVRSSRRSLAIEITKEACVRVRAPYWIPESEIERFINQKQTWIQEHLKEVQRRLQQAETAPKLSADQIQELAEKAVRVIPERVAFYAEKIGVTYGRITIRNQKTRWGSCSGKGNLNFNCMLMLAPPDVLDYVVVHELCHRKEMNHSSRFWSEVEKVLPNYLEKKKWLKENGAQLGLG